MAKPLSDELILANVTALLLTKLLVFLPPGIWRVVPGLPLMLFFPGYTLVAALFPRRSDLATVERIGLSLGLSIAATSLIGFIFNIRSWTITSVSTLVALEVFIVIISVVAWHRRHRLPQAERYGIFAELQLPSLRRQSRLNVALSFVLIVAILGAIGAMAYAVFGPKVERPFTEFYVLGSSPESYPKKAVVGKGVEIIVGIANHEQRTIIYMVEVWIDGNKINQFGPLELEHGGRLERVISFVPERPGVNQKVEFLLYKNAERDPTRTLHLWLDVSQPSSIP